jgi:hypothetical protein
VFNVDDNMVHIHNTEKISAIVIIIIIIIIITKVKPLATNRPYINHLSKRNNG